MISLRVLFIALVVHQSLSQFERMFTNLQEFYRILSSNQQKLDIAIVCFWVLKQYFGSDNQNFVINLLRKTSIKTGKTNLNPAN